MSETLFSNILSCMWRAKVIKGKTFFTMGRTVYSVIRFIKLGQFLAIIYVRIHSLVFSIRGRAGRNQSPVMWPVWLWHTASWASSWGSLPLFPPSLDVPTSAARCLYVRNDARDPSSVRWNWRREICPVILPKFRLPRKFRDLLHAANTKKACWGF